MPCFNRWWLVIRSQHFIWIVVDFVNKRILVRLSNTVRFDWSKCCVVLTQFSNDNVLHCLTSTVCVTICFLFETKCVLSVVTQLWMTSVRRFWSCCPTVSRQTMPINLLINFTHIPFSYETTQTSFVTKCLIKVVNQTDTFFLGLFIKIHFETYDGQLFETFFINVFSNMCFTSPIQKNFTNACRPVKVASLWNLMMMISTFIPPFLVLLSVYMCSVKK